MGAQLWQHIAGPHASPVQALREIQLQVLAEQDLRGLLASQLESARGAVELTEQDDEYGLLDFYREELAKFEELTEAGIPDDPEDQIAMLRRMNESSGQGIGNVLDVIGISIDGGMHVTRPCFQPELQDSFGLNHPTRREAASAVSQINERLERGESICFQIYADDRATCAGWMFVGNTID
jgi:hypothetical protein